MNYIKRLWKWIWEGKYLFIFLILIYFIFNLNKINIGLKPEDNIRVFGLILQLLGAITILYSLKDRLLLFKDQGFIKFFKDYFQRFPSRKFRKNVSIKAKSIGLSITLGEARVIIKPKEDLKDIIRYFDEENQYLHKRLMEIKNENKIEIKQLKDKIFKISNDLGGKIDETNDLIVVSSVSNIWIDFFGIACIILGLILGTTPDLINKFLF